MNLNTNNQINLYGLKNNFNELITLYNIKKFPNKILLSGEKGIGKCTLAYHLINFILSLNEEYPYDIENNLISRENKSFKLIQNKSNPNFNLIDVTTDKKNIDIEQIRNLIINLNKSSLNNKPRFVLIDNIELLNINSTNALLKILEEPNDNIFFILIHNNKKILSTLKSRCLNFKIYLSKIDSISVCNNLLDNDINDLINPNLLDHYFSPGKIYNLVKFSNDNSIDLKNIELKEFLSIIIEKNYYKKNNEIKYIIYDFFELFLLNNIPHSLNFHSYFVKQLEKIKKFNLDEESLFIEFKYKLLNG